MHEMTDAEILKEVRGIHGCSQDVTISELQRKFGIGYGRAATIAIKIMNEMLVDTVGRTTMSEDQKVDHPDHYNQGEMEVIDAVEGLSLCFCGGNVLKYIDQYQWTSELDDLEEAKWYLERMIQNAKPRAEITSEVSV